MGRTHELKLNENYADAVLSGEKSFEIRRNDRAFQRGDKVVFRVVDSLELPVAHSLNKKVFKITYVLSGYKGLQDGWCVFGIRKARERK